MTKETFTELILANEEILYKVGMSMLKNETDVKREEFFRTWLIRILINVCNKQLRQRKRRARFMDDHGVTTSSAEDVEVRAAVEALPLKIRQVIILYYSEQFTTKEIGEILRIPKGTVLSRLDRGRKLLKMELE